MIHLEWKASESGDIMVVASSSLCCQQKSDAASEILLKGVIAFFCSLLRFKA